SNQRFSLDYGGRAGAQSRWKIEYRYELDDRDDLDYGDAFSSYSAHRHSFGAGWAYASGQWRASLRADYRYSRYLDDNLFTDGSAVERQDHRYKMSLRGSWLFTSSWALTAEYSYTDNDSNIDSFDYDRQVMMLGIGWQF
ncbi:MAG: outer membrane beta-barrel protein, partial [Gammaproteobacteria bacterium]|nr:outer membrane beta-barrel protein [Gammaproteobacteria bacterium]